MANGDSKFRSRKFILAAGSLVGVFALSSFGTLELAKDAKDVAIIMTPLGTTIATVLGLYNYVNWKTGEQ